MAVKKHKKGSKVKVTKSMHSHKAGTHVVIASVHSGVYYGVHNPGTGRTSFVPDTHVEPPSDPPPPPSDPPPPPPVQQSEDEDFVTIALGLLLP